MILQGFFFWLINVYLTNNYVPHIKMNLAAWEKSVFVWPAASAEWQPRKQKATDSDMMRFIALLSPSIVTPPGATYQDYVD